MDRRSLLKSLVFTTPIPSGTCERAVQRASCEEPAIPGFATRRGVERRRILGEAERICVAGYHAPLDGGGGLYIRSKLRPSHAASVRSADGAWWELAEPVVNVRMFGAAGDGSSDDTAAIQSALDYLRQSRTKLLEFPAGTYALSDALIIRDAMGQAFVGTGGRGGVTLLQTADDAPIFRVSGKLVHSNKWCGMSAAWRTPADPAKRDRAFVQCVGPGDFYNNELSDLSVAGGHYVVSSDSGAMLVWGSLFLRWFVSDMSGGLTKLHGSAGQPNNRFESVYALCHTMRGPVFHHNAVGCQFDNVELNQAHRGPALIFDQGGGEYVIGTFGLEQGTYDAPVTLVDVTNGSLQARYFYLTIAVNADVAAFEVGNSRRSFAKVENAYFDPRPGSAGAFRVVRSRGKPLAADDPRCGFVEIGSLFDETKLGGRFCLFAPGDEAAAALIRVQAWADASRVLFAESKDLALRAYSPVTIVFADPAEGLSVTLPDAENVFTGRRFEISKTGAASRAELSVRTHAGEPLASIPAMRSGRVHILYDHARRQSDGQGWMVVGQETWS